MPRHNFVHLSGQFLGREDLFLKQDVGEGDNPPLVVGKLADHFAPQSLNAVAFLFSVDDLVKVQHVRERVTSLLSRFEFVLDALDRAGRQPAQFNG